MTQIIPQINQYQQPMTAYNVNAPLPIDNDKLKQGISNNSVVKLDEKKHQGLVVALTALFSGGIIWGMSLFNKACRGEYPEIGKEPVNKDGHKSIIKKVGDWGDKVSKKDGFKSFFEFFETKSKTVKGFLQTKVIDKSKILSAFFKTPSVPTNQMVVTMANGTTADVAGEAVKILEEYVTQNDSLASVGIKRDLVNKFKANPANEGLLNKLVKSVDEAKAKGLKLDEFGYTEDAWTNIKNAPKDNINKLLEIVEKQAAKGSKLADIHHELTDEILQTIKKEPSKHVDDIIKYFDSVDPEKHVKFAKLWKIHLPEKLGRSVYFSEIRNKLLALKNLENPRQTTALGKILPKTMVRGLEILTNGNAGGKIAMVMQAYFIADSVRAAIDAKKGEKGKTFAENLIYNLGWFATMPLGIRLMHKFGGLQYIGMSKETLEQYREKVADFNEKAKLGVGAEGGFDTVEAAKTARAELKDILKAKANTKWFHRPIKWFGKVIAVGLETPRGITKATDNGFVKAMKNSAFKMKDWAGYPMRFGLFMFLIAPFLAKLAAKGSHVVFGKPSKSVLDENKDEKPKEQLIGELPAGAQLQNQSLIQPGRNMVQPNNMQYNQAGRQSVQVQPMQMQPVRSYVPSDEPVKLVSNQQPMARGVVAPQASLEPKRNYIPSDAGVVAQQKAQKYQQQSPENDPKIAQAMNNSVQAEQAALKIMSGGH